MTAEEIAQWAVDNRHSKGEGRDKSDHEIYHHLRDSIEAYAQQQPRWVSDEEIDNLAWDEKDVVGAMKAVRDLIFNGEKRDEVCDHPFFYVRSKCDGELNHCLKCGEYL